MLGNIVLFFPFGLVGIWSVSIRNAIVRDAMVLALAFILAFSLQLAQVWLPSRSAALVDVVWNMAGAGLGIVAAHMAVGRAGVGKLAIPSATLAPLGLLMLWLLAELSPLVPSLDLQKFKDALKPLMYGIEFSFPDVMAHAAGVFAAGSALATLVLQPTKWLFGLLALILAGKLIIVHLALDASILTGFLVGYLAWLLVPASRGKERFGFAFWGLFLAWTIVALMPFSAMPGGNFNSIPFATMLKGSMEVNAQGMAQSLFIYTGLLWFAQKRVGRISVVMVGLVLWACLLELTQMLLLGRTADITEPILILLIGWLLTALQRHQNIQVPPTQPLKELGKSSARRMKILDAIPRIGWSAKLGFSIIGMAALMWAMLRVPSVPYNVRELIAQGHPILSALALACAIAWIFGFPAWAAMHMATGSRRPAYLLPFLLLHGIVAWVLLRRAVPLESIHDIVGSPILGWPWEWEAIGRFISLFTIWSVVSFGAGFLTLRSWLPKAGGFLWLWAVATLALLPVAYVVVIQQAATDNLTELLAGGGTPMAFLWVAAGLFMLALAGAQLAVALGSAMRVGVIRGALWSIASFPLTYLALHAGFESYIIKYGQAFSAFQFLLSQDRAHYAAPMELLLRYGFAHGILLFTIAASQAPFLGHIVLTHARLTIRPVPEQESPRKKGQSD